MFTQHFICFRVTRDVDFLSGRPLDYRFSRFMFGQVVKAQIFLVVVESYCRFFLSRRPIFQLFDTETVCMWMKTVV